MAVEGSTVRNFLVTAIIDGVTFSPFEVKTGGELDSEEQTYLLGGMGQRISLGGQRVPGNVTINRIFDFARDHVNGEWFRQRVGNGTTMEVHQQPLDKSGKPWGQAIIYNGTFKRWTPPEVNSNSNDPALIELEMTVATMTGGGR